MTKQKQRADDPVTAAARERAAQANGRARDAERRLNRVREAIVGPDDRKLRPNASREAAARAEELEGLKARAGQRDAELKRAEADQPRRERERERAVALEAELADAERAVDEARQRLTHAEAARDAKAGERDAALASANRVQPIESEAA